VGFVQNPFAHEPLAQTLPQAPQLLGSLMRSGVDVAVATTVIVVVGVVVSVAAIS